MLLAGIAVTDSVVYVVETQRATLWLLRPGDLTPVRRAGREGKGPGEWHPFGSASHGGSQRWVHASAAGVRLFDAQRIQEFRPDGRFRRLYLNAAQQAGISPLQSRLAFVGDTLVYSSGGHDIFNSILRAGNMKDVRRDELVGGRQLWFVRMRVGDDVRDVLQLGLVPLPPKVPVGPAQARPLWDLHGTCVVASDGAEPLLVHASLGGGAQDTVRVALPDRADRAADYEGMMGGLLPPGTRLGEPTAATRVRDLIVDPDGYVWLRPVQPRGGLPEGMEVIRVPLGSGPAVTDTVPAFPRAFGGPGVYFAEERGPDDELLVTRYDLRSGG